jgi:hypothetical protein
MAANNGGSLQAVEDYVRGRVDELEGSLEPESFEEGWAASKAGWDLVQVSCQRQRLLRVCGGMCTINCDLMLFR